MAERRMFAKSIVDSDAFLDMPLSSQALYFHLAMRADDDGFINNHRKIQRMVGANDDDLRLLLAKNFLIAFESGVMVVRHWKIHNYIQRDRYKPTIYAEEKDLLLTGQNKAYELPKPAWNPGEIPSCPDSIQSGYNLDTQVRLGKDRLDQDSSRLGECEREGAGEAPRTSPNEEEPGEKKKAQPAVPDYSRTDFSPAMIAKINEWLDYKAEKRQRYKPTGLKSLIAQIEKQAHRYGESAVIALIEDCMAANYQGIIWDKLERSGGKPTAQTGKNAAQLLGEMIEQDEMESGFPLYGSNYREVEEN